MKRSKPAGSATHRVYDVINRPLTIWGVERRLWLFAAMLGVGIFNASTSILAGLLLFVTLYSTARAATRVDPQLFRILMRGARYRRRYDAAKYVPARVVVRR